MLHKYFQGLSQGNITDYGVLFEEFQENGLLAMHIKHIAQSVSHMPQSKFDKQKVTPKLTHMVRLMKQMMKKFDNFCCIIFVERRLTALALETLFAVSEDLTEKFKVRALLGHGKKTFMDADMNSKQ